MTAWTLTSSIPTRPPARCATLGGLVAPAARAVTYATRGMEPHRHFPQFMSALPHILAADPRTVAVIAGENRVAYAEALRRTDWQAEALRMPGLDPARVRFVGRLRGTTTSPSSNARTRMFI